MVCDSQYVGYNQPGSSGLVFEDALIPMIPYSPVDYGGKSFEG